MSSPSTTSSSTLAPPSEESRRREQSNILSVWVDLMDQLLDTLHASYSDDPENPNYDSVAGGPIASKRNDFKNLVLPFEPLQKKAIEGWHESMNPFYDMCREKRDSDILKAGCWILEEIQFPHVWADESFGKESREVMWTYVNGLNSYAQMYVKMPANVLSKVDTIAQKCEEAGIPTDPKDIGLKEVLQMSSTAYKNIDGKDIREFADNLPQIFEAIGEEGGIESFLDEMGAGQFKGVIQSAVQFSQSVMKGEEPAMDMKQMLQTVTSAFGEMMPSQDGTSGEGSSAEGVTETKTSDGSEDASTTE